MNHLSLDICGNTAVFTFTLFGILCTISIFILIFLRKEISRKIFFSAGFLLIILALLYTVQYEYHSCRPSDWGGSYTEYEFQMLPKNIFPIKK